MIPAERKTLIEKSFKDFQPQYFGSFRVSPLNEKLKGAMSAYEAKGNMEAGLIKKLKDQLDMMESKITSEFEMY